MIEPDFDAMDKERERPDREKQLTREIYTLKYMQADYAYAIINAEESHLELMQSKDNLELQEKRVKELIERL